MSDSVVIDRDLGWKDLLRSLRGIEAVHDKASYVGVHGKEGSDLVIYAASNEYGTRDGHVPERSYIRSTVDENKVEVGRRLEAAVDDALDGGNLERGLGRVGEWMVGEIKTKIATLQEPANAPTTKAAKKRKNGKEGKPLIDSSRLFGSISQEVK